MTLHTPVSNLPQSWENPYLSTYGILLAPLAGVVVGTTGPLTAGVYEVESVLTMTGNSATELIDLEHIDAALTVQTAVRFAAWRRDYCTRFPVITIAAGDSFRHITVSAIANTASSLFQWRQLPNP